MAGASRVVAFPPGTDPGPRLALLNSELWDSPRRDGTAYRRAVTARDPLLFAITYLGEPRDPVTGHGGFLRDRVTQEMSFSPLHLDLAAEGRHWVVPGPRRHAWVAPREAAKSGWLGMVLPLWAVAHGHVHFFLVLGSNAEQAVGHLADIRVELEANEVLLYDFPELAPVRRRGTTDTARTVVRSGATLAARGLGTTSRGLRSGADRPDYILIDDAERGEGTGMAATEKVIRVIAHDILPMNTRARVMLTGTVTAPGSMMHQVVDAAKGRAVAPWLADEGWVCHHYDAIVTGPDGTERSLWPQRWPLAELQAARGTRAYSLNMANDPQSHEQGPRWRPELHRSPARFPAVRRVLHIDVAVTERSTSDHTAIVVAGLDESGRSAVIEHAEQGRWTGLQTREKVWELVGPHPQTLRDVVVEVNQGGQRWREILAPLPPGVRLTLYTVSGDKRTRILWLLDHYERMAVWHRRPLAVLEDQQLAWPRGGDDLLDSEAGALRWLWTGSAED